LFDLSGHYFFEAKKNGRRDGLDRGAVPPVEDPGRAPAGGPGRRRPRRRALPRGRARRRASGGGGGAPGAVRDVRGVHGGRGARAGGGKATVRALVPRRLHRALVQDQDHLPYLPRGAAAAGEGGGGGRRPPAAVRGVVHDARGHVAQLAQLLFLLSTVQLQTYSFFY
jgi:hypothetical protein